MAISTPTNSPSKAPSPASLIGCGSTGRRRHGRGLRHRQLGAGARDADAEIGDPLTDRLDLGVGAVVAAEAGKLALEIEPLVLRLPSLEPGALGDERPRDGVRDRGRANPVRIRRGDVEEVRSESTRARTFSRKDSPVSPGSARAAALSTWSVVSRMLAVFSSRVVASTFSPWSSVVRSCRTMLAVAS